MKKLLKNQLNLFFLFLLAFAIIACQSESSERNIDTPPVADTIKVNPEETKPEQSEQKKYELPKWPIKAKNVKGKVYPFDEGRKDSSFVAFRQRLYQAVREKDTEYLLSVISEDIKYSFGDSDGKQGFLSLTGLKDNPQESEVWNELAKCLELGGGFFDFQDYSFYAPFVFMTDKLEDPYETGVIIGDNVRLRGGPGSSHEIKGALSWDIVTVIYSQNAVEETIGGETHYWVHVKTLGGEEGYVFGKYFRLAIDYRAGFGKNDTGQWMMKTFIAGD